MTTQTNITKPTGGARPAVTHSTCLGLNQYVRSDCSFRDEIAQCEETQCEGTKEQVLAHLAEMMAIALADERESLEWELRGSSYAQGEAAVRMVNAEIVSVEAYEAKFLAAKAEGMDDDDAMTAASK